jgi:hypothetical protein
MEDHGEWYSGPSHTCVPTPDYSTDTLVGPCDLQDLPGYNHMNCFRLEFNVEGLLVPDSNGTQYRCGCNKLFPLNSPTCDEPGEWQTLYNFAVALFSVQFIISMLLFLKAAHGFAIIFQDQKATKKKFDTVAVTTLMNVFGGFFTSIMTLSFVLRTSASIDDQAFGDMLFAFPFTVMFCCQGFNGLALAWLDIAIKSDKMDGGNNIKKYENLKKFLKGFVVFLFFACAALYLSDRTAQITILANLMALVLSIALRIGGARIVGMLKKGGDAKSLNVARAMKNTYDIMIWSQPVLLLAGGYYTKVYIDVTSKGVRDGWGISFSVGFMTLCLHLSLWAMIDFVQKVRINAIKKVGTTYSGASMSTVQSQGDGDA